MQGHLQPAGLSEVSISGVCCSVQMSSLCRAATCSQRDGCLRLPAGHMLRPLPSSAGLLCAEAISAHLKTHFGQSNATIKLTETNRYGLLNRRFVTLDGKTRMRESSFASILPQK